MGVWLYELHMGGLAAYSYPIPDEDLYCEQCGDSDWELGEFETLPDFLRYYDYRMPVGTNDCVMNKICRRFESEFDGYVGKHNAAIKFDYTIMRSNADYSNSQFNAIKKLYEDFNKRLRNYAVFADYERIDECDSFAEMSMINDEFRRECKGCCWCTCKSKSNIRFTILRRKN